MLTICRRYITMPTRKKATAILDICSEWGNEARRIFPTKIATTDTTGSISDKILQGKRLETF